MARAVEIAKGSGTLIIGNGDIHDLRDAQEKIKATGCDGIMIGRGVFGNPWLFDEAKTNVTVRERLEAVVVLTELFEQAWGDTKNFELLKKHFQAYVVGFSGARELRAQLMLIHDGTAVKKILSRYIDENPVVCQSSIELVSVR
jgi:tRNA-dihydrouridine synthase